MGLAIPFTLFLKKKNHLDPYTLYLKIYHWVVPILSSIITTKKAKHEEFKERSTLF